MSPQHEASVATDTAWSAVLSRDASFDGRFFYGVTSTKIYCRPSCPSRRPNRERVRFFEAPESAEAAGFRACRRCRPRAVASPAVDTVRRACSLIDARLEDGLAISEIAEQVGLSPSRLQRSFKDVLGISPKAYQRSRRVERLKEWLRRSASVTDAVYEAGYGSGSRVYEQADARLGMTPATYRQGGDGAAIRFATAAAPLGRLLVAVSDRGVCAISLGDSDAGLEEDLREELPGARIERDDDGLRPTIEAVVAHIAGDPPRVAVPLDIRATAFEERVWQCLRAIPRGVTRTYSEVAAAIGRPTAARAVASACGRNRLAVAIPCHRVVAGDGGTGGYRWGVERKVRLLEQERTI